MVIQKNGMPKFYNDAIAEVGVYFDPTHDYPTGYRPPQVLRSFDESGDVVRLCVSTYGGDLPYPTTSIPTFRVLK